MDPLSIVAGVAGIATAGVQLANVLFDTVSTYKNAPKDITLIARGIKDLSMVLDQLIEVLEDGWELHTRRLRKSISSAVRQIGNVHIEVWELIERGESGFGRIKWAFRKKKMNDLMSKIEAQKSTVQLVCTTLLLAAQQTKIIRSEESRMAKRRRARLRWQAESLVKAAHESMMDLSQASTLDVDEPATALKGIEDTQRKQELEPQLLEDSSSPRSSPSKELTRPPATDEETSPPNSNQALERKTCDKAALWVYDTVFARTAERQTEEQESKLQQDSTAVILRNTHGTDIVVPRRPMAALIVDDLLLDWTRLSWNDIKQTSQSVSGSMDAKPREQPSHQSNAKGDLQGSNTRANQTPSYSQDTTRRSGSSGSENSRLRTQQNINVPESSPRRRTGNDGSRRKAERRVSSSDRSGSREPTTRRKDKRQFDSKSNTSRYSPIQNLDSQDNSDHDYDTYDSYDTDSDSEGSRWASTKKPKKSDAEGILEDVSRRDSARKDYDSGIKSNTRHYHGSKKQQAGTEDYKKNNRNSNSFARDSKPAASRSEPRSGAAAKDDEAKAKRMELSRLAGASLAAGAAEAIRVRDNAGTWDNEKIFRVISAGLGAASAARTRSLRAPQ